jgi:hypothetical protein
MILLRALLCGLPGLLPYVALGAEAATGSLQVGRHHSPGGGCEVRISTSSENGARELSLVRPKSALVTPDVTGAIWRDPNTLVYSVSPIYGRPGLFELDCRSGYSKTIVPPATRDKGYPDGADYFELVSVDPKIQQACFYYSADVDSPDLDNFRVPEHLRCVQVNKPRS